MALQTVTEHLREHMLTQAGMGRMHRDMPSLDELEQTEWSPRFERLMRNRLIMGAFRYERLHTPGKPRYDRTARVHREMDAYERDGNLEHLVDAANILLLEFEEGRHPLAHWGPQDDNAALHSVVIG